MTAFIRHRGPGRPPGSGVRLPTGADRRRTRRYRLDLGVELDAGRGVTRNVSESGLLVETQVSLSVGHDVAFNLELGRFDPQGPYHIKCAGKVVRIEPHESAQSVAIHLTSYDVN